MNFFSKITFEQHILPLGIIILSLVLGFIVKRILVKRIAKAAKATRTRLDDILVKALRSVVVVWFILIGLYISINILNIAPDIKGFVQKLFQALLIFSLFWFFMNLLGEIFWAYSRGMQERIPEASIIKNAIKIFVLSLGILIIFQIMGISITPLITTLGIGGLAIALALQETLANLFAGFHIVGTQRVKPGDYIKLDDNIEGYVVDVTWRDTLLKQLPDNHVIIPNNELASAILVNYHRPQKVLKLLVEIGVDYSSDLEKVERVTNEVAAQTLKEVEGGIDDFEPFIRFHTFADSSINFTVHLQCREFFDRILVKHEFIKRLKKRYDLEGINIPFPIRTVYMQKDG